MKGRFLSVLLLVTFMLVLLQPQPCESKRWRSRKFFRRVRIRKVVRPLVCALSCKTACHMICSGVCNLICRPACSRVCNRRKNKRGLIGARLTNEVSDDPRLKGAFPSSLKVFDKDKDGKISREEFSITAVSHVHPDLGTKEAFMLSDKNGDHYIDCKEFKMAPLRFEKKPSC